MFILTNRQGFKQQKPIVTLDMLHFNSIQNVQVIIPAPDHYDAIPSVTLTTSKINPFIPHTLHTHPISTHKILTVSQISHKLTLHFPWLHLTPNDLYFITFRHQYLLVECPASLHRHAVGD